MKYHGDDVMDMANRLLILLFTCITLQSCATNPSENSGLSSQAYATTPSVQDQSYMYRSPPANALRSHGLAR